MKCEFCSGEAGCTCNMIQLTVQEVSANGVQSRGHYFCSPGCLKRFVNNMNPPDNVNTVLSLNVKDIQRLMRD